MIRNLLLASFLWSLGANLVYFFLNFHLEALGFGREAIGLAQALFVGVGVAFALPLAWLIPRLGYLRSFHLALGLALLGGGLLSLGLLPLLGVALYGLAGTVLQGAMPALVARVVPEGERVRVFSLQAALTTATGFLSTLLAGLLSDRLGARAVLPFALPFFLLALPLIRGLAEGQGALPRFGGRFALWLKLFLPNAVIAFGAGLVIPFLNLYLKEKFGLSYSATGLIFALSSLATGAAMLLQPLLVRRVGGWGRWSWSRPSPSPSWPPWPGPRGFPW